ncbi:MAG: lysozyme inhibitor LprI family protein [Candidatus Binatia bacterium]
MKIGSAVLASICLFIATISYAGAEESKGVEKDECAELQGQQNLNRCYQAQYHRVDKELNGIYRKLTSNLQSRNLKDELERLRTVQKEWINFRDKSCAFESDRYRGGSMEPMVRSLCLIRETRYRNQTLRGLLKEYELEAQR